MTPLLPLAWMLAVAAAPAAESFISVAPIRSPFCLVTESVTISVSSGLSLVDGDYDFKYVSRIDASPNATNFGFSFPVFAAKDIEDLDTLVAATQPHLQIGSLDLTPASFQPVPDNVLGDRRFVSDQVRAYLVVFVVPRALLHQQARMHFSYAQSSYPYAGREVVPYLPLLPDFEGFKNELLFSRDDFTVTVEALDSLRLQRLSANRQVVRESPKQIVIHPVDRELLAVAADPPAKP
jgi:hypothetical protein